jgi:hypothetical protein
MLSPKLLDAPRLLALAEAQARQFLQGFWASDWLWEVIRDGHFLLKTRDAVQKSRLSNGPGCIDYAATMWFLTAYFTSSALLFAPSTSIMRYL